MPEPAQDSEQGQGLGLIGEIIAKEAIGMGVFLALMWYMGPGRAQLRAAWVKVRSYRARDSARADRETAGLARDISRWEHEHAKEPHTPAAPGGCGCQ
jgi:hypothetical protein